MSLKEAPKASPPAWILALNPPLDALKPWACAPFCQPVECPTEVLVSYVGAAERTPHDLQRHRRCLWAQENRVFFKTMGRLSKTMISASAAAPSVVIFALAWSPAPLLNLESAPKFNCSCSIDFGSIEDCPWPIRYEIAVSTHR